MSAIGGSCFGIAVQGNYAYVGEGRNFLVLDVTTPSSPSKVGRLTLPGIIRGIALLNQYAYVADEEGGMQVVDISSPTTPKYAGFYSTTNQPWSAGITIYGGRAYVADEVAGLQIFDLGNPIAPALLSTTNIGSGEAIIADISHMVSCPRPAWAFFVIFVLLHRFARTFYPVRSGCSLAQGCFDAFLARNAPFLLDAKTPLPCLSLFSCDC